MNILTKASESVGYAFMGLRTAFTEEHNFRIELLCAVLALGAGWFFEISQLEFIAVLLTIGFVLTAELFNTALEAFADAIDTTHNLHIGKMKDVSAGAVFVACLTALVVGVTIFAPPLAKLLPW